MEWKRARIGLRDWRITGKISAKLLSCAHQSFVQLMICSQPFYGNQSNGFYANELENESITPKIGIFHGKYFRKHPNRMVRNGNPISWARKTTRRAGMRCYLQWLRFFLFRIQLKMKFRRKCAFSSKYWFDNNMNRDMNFLHGLNIRIISKLFAKLIDCSKLIN